MARTMPKKPIEPVSKPYEELPERQQRFIDEYLKSGKATEAYIKAGYNPSSAASKANAYKLYRQLYRTIQGEIEKRIGTDAIMALSVVRKLAHEATSEAVRLSAAQDILKRAGYDKPVETKLTIDDLRDVDNEDIDEQLKELISASIAEPGPQH